LPIAVRRAIRGARQAAGGVDRRAVHPLRYAKPIDACSTAGCGWLSGVEGEVLIRKAERVRESRGTTRYVVHDDRGRALIEEAKALGTPLLPDEETPMSTPVRTRRTPTARRCGRCTPLAELASSAARLDTATHAGVR
jgi:hypothetical protein